MHEFHSGESIEPENPPVWDDKAEASAVQIAGDVMTAYSRPTLTRDEWWAGIAPYLDAIAARDYAWVDPASIAATRVSTGSITVARGASDRVAIATVPTDAGAYTLTLSRLDAKSPWQVSRIELPKGLR